MTFVNFKELAEKMQEYIDGSDEMIALGTYDEGASEADVEFVLPVRHAAQLFNDFLLYLNNGCRLQHSVIVPPPNECRDEGCPNAGTSHVCNPPKAG